VSELSDMLIQLHKPTSQYEKIVLQCLSRMHRVFLLSNRICQKCKDSKDHNRALHIYVFTVTFA